MAADKGDVRAESMLARVYLSDPYGNKDPEKGLLYLEKAVNKSDPEAIYTFAILNLNGGLVKQNIQKAYVLASIAKNLGNKKASNIIEIIESKLNETDLTKLRAYRDDVVKKMTH